MNKENKMRKFDAVSRIGQGHYWSDNDGSGTLCGKPWLSSNYVKFVKVQFPCQECIELKTKGETK